MGRNAEIIYSRYFETEDNWVGKCLKVYGQGESIFCGFGLFILNSMEFQYISPKDFYTNYKELQSNIRASQ